MGNTVNLNLPTMAVRTGFHTLNSLDGQTGT